MYDVAVIGAGPIGSRLAYRLAGMGCRVIVLEEKAGLAGPVCCSGIISEECVNHFGVDRSVIIREANSARVFSPSGKILSLKRPEPQACIVDRTAFNLSLARQAEAQGAEYVFNSSVVNLDIQPDGVRIDLGQKRQIEARAAVIAAGSASKLVEKLGFGKVGDFCMGAQAVVEAPGLKEVEVYLGAKVAPGFFGWLVPFTPGKALVGLLSRRQTSFYTKRLISSLAVEGKLASDKVEISVAPVPLKPLAKTFAERVIVVGSAAGQVKPVTGGGIYYGLLCADIAAENLYQALEEDNLSAKNLDKYEKAWQKRLGREIRTSYWSRRFYELLSDRRIDSIFDIIKSNGIDKALLEAEDVAFDWHGKAVLKLLGHRALARFVEAMRFSLPPGR